MLEQESDHIITILGSANIGKSSLLQAFQMCDFTKKYTTTETEFFNKKIEIDGQELDIVLWNACCRNANSSVRNLAFANTKIFLICFSIENVGSLKDVLNCYAPEAHDYLKTSEIILVGLKKDLRDTLDPKKLVVYDDVQKTKKRILAVEYIECSALTGRNVENLFRIAGRYIIDRDIRKKMKSKSNMCCHC